MQLNFSSSLSIGAFAGVLDLEERAFCCHSLNFWLGGFLDMLVLLDVTLVARMATGVAGRPLPVVFKHGLTTTQTLNV